MMPSTPIYSRPSPYHPPLRHPAPNPAPQPHSHSHLHPHRPPPASQAELSICEPCRRKKRNCDGRRPCNRCDPRAGDCVDASPEAPRRLSSGSACETCRRRKTKCDGGQPCGYCATNGIECVSGAERRRRGQQLQGTVERSEVDQLEARLKRMERLIEQLLRPVAVKALEEYASKHPTSGEEEGVREVVEALKKESDSLAGGIASARAAEKEPVFYPSPPQYHPPNVKPLPPPPPHASRDGNTPSIASLVNPAPSQSPSGSPPASSVYPSSSAAPFPSHPYSAPTYPHSYTASAAPASSAAYPHPTALTPHFPPPSALLHQPPLKTEHQSPAAPLGRMRGHSPPRMQLPPLSGLMDAGRA
ncbi:uncharacterized protein VTP21DRAFT_71 [Calcarisporiella thermophila]|uniref:uncharacterized protein n=1 Tax=Calcarisporiella thermophila TaxID=911321 RepID=UPI00374333B5